MKWIVEGDHESLPQWFNHESEAKDYVKALIKKAEEELDESGYPDYIWDIQIAEIKWEIQEKPYEGLQIVEKK